MNSSVPKWVWVSVAMVLVAGVVFFDTIVRRRQNPLGKSGGSDKLTSMVTSYTRVGQDRGRLTSIIEDSDLPPNERQQAVIELAKVLDEGGLEEEKIELLRKAMELFEDEIDTLDQAKVLFKYYSGRPAAEDKEAVSRDDSGLRWVLKRRRANLEALHGNTWEFVSGLTKLADRAVRFDLYREALPMLETALDISRKFGNVSGALFDVPARLYRLGKKENNEHKRSSGLELLNRAKQIAGANITVEAITIIFDIYTIEGDTAQLESLAMEFLSRMEKENAGKAPSSVSFDILKIVYEKQGNQQKLDALAARRNAGP